jgi:drug/metabolite transporter (DMT)-like permease
VAIKDALADCGPFTLTALRMATGSVAAILLLRPKLLRASSLELRAGALGGLLLAGGYLLQTIGLRTAGAGVGGFLTALYVVLVPVIDAAVFRRWPRLRDVAGLLVAAVGLGLITLDPDRLGLASGEALVAVSAFFWAGQIVLVGRVAARVDPATLSTLQLVVVTVVASAALPFVGEKPVHWSGDLVSAIFFLGYVTCALGFAVQVWAQRRFPPTRTAIVFSAEPVFAAFFGWWFQDEVFGPRKLAGAGFVLAAVALALAPQKREA